MSKISEFPTKTTPVWADKLTWLDSQTSNVSLQNKNFALSSLWSAIFWARTTTDIPEWSNLYYTNSRTLAVAVGLDWDDTINDVKTFTSSPIVPTPTTPTQVANKAYVDAQSIPIDPLPEETVWDMDVDFLVKSDWVSNEKVLVSRYRASDAEATAGTNNKKFISAKQVKDNYSFQTSIASDTVIEEEGTEYTNLGTTQTLVWATIKCMFRGTIRVVYDWAARDGWSSSFTAILNITRNWSIVWTTRNFAWNDPVYQTFTEDISVNFWDEIRLFIRYAKIRNFSVRWTLTPWSLYTYKF